MAGCADSFSGKKAGELMVPTKMMLGAPFGPHPLRQSADRV
jgi:hypothetical protein